MNYVNTYYKGYLLWVDDNFIEIPLEKDEDKWVKLFGDQSDHIFRLMDLHLIIATTYDEGKQRIEELEELEKQGAYIFCILDLRLPKNRKNREFISSQYGIKLAKLAQKKGFNAVFLTTESNREKLLEEGLASIQYYQKLSREQMIPGDLVRYILSNFRAHISWISLEDIYGGLKNENTRIDKMMKENLDHLPTLYFPFSNTFRDFVERWEYRPLLKRGTIVIFRCPQSYGDPFIQQCLLVTLNNMIQEYPKRVSFRYAGASGPHIVGSSKEVTGITVNAIRIDPKKNPARDFLRLLKEIPKTWTGSITYFILPNDESSDEYLEQSVKVPRVMYEDLPAIRIGDIIGRENFIRSALNLVLQHVKILSAENVETALGDIYLACPEILIKPLIWVILLESSKVAEKLSDPYEIIDQIEKQASRIKGDELDLANRQQLIDGEPIPVSKLFEFGVDILKSDRSIDFDHALQEDWFPKSLKLWLTKSWQFPYGFDKKFIKDREAEKNAKTNGNGNLQEKWEEFSLEVLLDLVNSYTLKQGTPELDAVYGFLKHGTITALLEDRANKIPEEEWTDLLGEKWPHHEYPLPAALNKKLIDAGRYLWVETDNFNLTRIFPTTRLRHQYLDDVVNKIGKQLKWIEFQSPHLPSDWSFYIGKFIKWLSQDQIQTQWQTNRQQVYDHLLDFYKKSLPISYIAYSILDKKFNTEEGITETLNRLKKMRRPGELIGLIRDIRNRNIFTFIRPSAYWFFTSRRQTFEISNYYTHLTHDFCSRVQVDQLIKKLKSGNLLCRVYEELSREDAAALLEILGVEELTPKICKAILNTKKLAWDKKNRLFQFLESKIPLKSLSSVFDRDTDPAVIIDRFFKKIMETCRTTYGKEKSLVFEEILDDISKINAALTAGFQPTDSCDDFYEDEECGTFFSSPFDMFEFSLNAHEKMYMTLLRLNYIDGYHFLNSIRWLRNKGNENPPSGDYVRMIEFIFELFCFGIEALVAQLKFLLEIAGETDLADKISLQYVEKINVPREVKIPSRETLKEFFQVKRKNNGKTYNLYHLGIKGTEVKNRQAYILNKVNHILEEEGIKKN
jgi:hypothetical protein